MYDTCQHETAFYKALERLWTSASMGALEPNPLWGLTEGQLYLLTEEQGVNE